MELTVESLLNGYLQGRFPMADPDTGVIDWYTVRRRGIIPLEPDRFHVPKSLAREVRKGRFRITCDTAFEQVIRNCATDRSEENRTWISDEIIRAYTKLHECGYAHSIEAWLGDELVGGLYGVHFNAAFFGESMFSRPKPGGKGGTNASKICLVHLVAHLQRRGFRLLDAQFPSQHLEQFGCTTVSSTVYATLLVEAIVNEVTWGELFPIA